MKLLAFAAVLAVSGYGQAPPASTAVSAGIPGPCTIGERPVRARGVTYECSKSNTWTAVGVAESGAGEQQQITYAIQCVRNGFMLTIGFMGWCFILLFASLAHRLGRIEDLLKKLAER